MDNEDNGGSDDKESKNALMDQLVNEENDSGFIMQVNLNIDNEDYWAYLMVPSKNYDAFMEAQAKGLCNIKEYGDVIEWGDGLEPPPHVIKKLENEYGVMPELADKLHDMSDSLEERLERMGGKQE